MTPAKLFSGLILQSAGRWACHRPACGEPTARTGHAALVVPHNVYLEMPQRYKASAAAAVSRSAAIRGEDGQIVTDVVRDELMEWVQRHGRTGLPVAPGTVVVTSSGEMAKQNIRRLYHAAIAVPRPGTNEYDVEPPVLAQAVRRVLATARAERDGYDPPLRSIGWPLLGAGRGGLLPATSFAWLWIALERELAEDGPWDIHFIARRRVAADLIAAKLAEAVVIARPRASPADGSRGCAERTWRAGGQSGVSGVRRWGGAMGEDTRGPRAGFPPMTPVA